MSWIRDLQTRLHQVAGRPGDWRKERLTGWLADWLADWLTDRPSDWLTLYLFVCLFFDGLVFIFFFNFAFQSSTLISILILKLDPPILQWKSLEPISQRSRMKATTRKLTLCSWSFVNHLLSFKDKPFKANHLTDKSSRIISFPDLLYWRAHKTSQTS